MLKVTLHLDFTIISAPFDNCCFFDHELRKCLYDQFNYSEFLNRWVSKMSPKTVYSVRDNFESHYAFYPLPDEPDKVAFIGPYIIDEPKSEFLSKVVERNQLKSSMKYRLQTYYHSLPFVDSQTVISTINEIANLLYGGADSYTVMFFDELWNNIDVRSRILSPNDEGIISMQVLEEQYALENTLLSAITVGDRRKAIAAIQNFSTYTSDVRTPDPIRNTKNYGHTLNTLYRKAAEKSCIHPVYLDDISKRFAIQIEQTQSLIKLNNIILDMTRNYCILVKKHTLRAYSPMIRKTIDYVNINLSGPLSLNLIASQLSVNASYLSSMFKQEVKMTLTEYINSQRVHTAIELLNSTDLNIQSIAWHVGINDVNYFSRIFKKIIGVTPTVYRNTVRV